MEPGHSPKSGRQRDPAQSGRVADPARASARLPPVSPTCQIGFWDGGRICQAFANLVVNAVEHGEPGGPVRVEIDGADDEVAVRIHNRGDAISAARLDTIFSPMKLGTTSGHASGASPNGSLGLGLYIAERIVSAHGGRIEVESSQAGGTAFTVHVPRGP